jgi:hypothetical protein
VIANSAAANSTGTTFQAGDQLTGGSGTDTLNISITGGTAGTNSAVTLTSIEKVLVSNFNANTQSISLALADSDLTTVGNSSSDSTSTTTFTGLKKIVDVEASNGSGNVTVTYDSTVTTGTADTQAITLSNQAAGTITVNGVETVTVASNTADNSITLAGDSVATITASGSQSLDLNSIDASVTALNASAMTGGLTAVLSADTDVTVTGGAGNDSFTFTTATSTGSLVGGSGTDSLTYNLTGTIAANAVTSNNIISSADVGALYTGFETFNLKTSAIAGTANLTTDTITGGQDMDYLSGITTLIQIQQQQMTTSRSTSRSATLPQQPLR